MNETYRPRRKVWPWVTAAAVLFIAGAVTLALFVTSDSDDAGANPFGFAILETELSQAAKSCTSGDLADEDHTLVIDMTGEDLGSGTASFDELTCVLAALDTPTSVIARMESTRALDGMQSATWADFEATWTYHPDDGLDVIITQSS